jgi:hypothetical protein
MATDSVLHYRRCGHLLRLDVRLTPLDIHDLAIGLFARLEDDDRVRLMHDMLLLHTEPEEFLSTRASAVARALVGDQVINLDAVAPMFHAELPRVG